MADKSSLIAHFQQQAGSWLSRAEIHAGLPSIPERTLSRWLRELSAEGVLERSGQRKGTRYRWHAESEEPHPETGIFSAASLQHLQRVKAPLYTRAPVSYAEKWVDSYVPNQSFYLDKARREQLHRQGKRPGVHGHAGTYIQKIYNRLLIDLSYNSSRLEGNTYTLADTERLVIQGIGADGKLKEEQVMILNHKEAIRYLVRDPSRLVLGEETVRTLHYLLADGLVAPELAGQIRDEGVLISGSTYSPLEGKERLQRLLVSLLEKAGAITDPFEQSFFLLGHISYLQAFVDVNKRLARLTSIIPLIQNDYVPQSFVDADKQDYLDALVCLYERNETGPLADLYCWSYERTCQHYDTSVQVLGFDEIAILYRPQRRAVIADTVRSLRPLAKVAEYLAANMPAEIKPEHREKFVEDVMVELRHLDMPRVAGLGIDRRELEQWQRIQGEKP